MDQKPPADASLSPAAEAVLAAFESMRDSKHAYFSLLQHLDEQYRQWGQPSELEKQQLEHLLEAHNVAVQAFNQAMSRVEDTDDRLLLIQRMNALSEAAIG